MVILDRSRTNQQRDDVKVNQHTVKMYLCRIKNIGSPRGSIDQRNESKISLAIEIKSDETVLKPRLISGSGKQEVFSSSKLYI